MKPIAKNIDTVLWKSGRTVTRTARKKGIKWNELDAVYEKVKKKVLFFSEIRTTILYQLYELKPTIRIETNETNEKT